MPITQSRKTDVMAKAQFHKNQRVYVKPVGWLTPLYMALIDPFRRWIVYPALIRRTQAAWLAVHCQP